MILYCRVELGIKVVEGYGGCACLDDRYKGEENCPPTSITALRTYDHRIVLKERREAP